MLSNAGHGQYCPPQTNDMEKAVSCVILYGVLQPREYRRYQQVLFHNIS